MTTKTPGQAARATHWQYLGTKDELTPKHWDAIAAAAIGASPELKRLRAEAEQMQLELNAANRAVGNNVRENERLRQRVAELEALNYENHAAAQRYAARIRRLTGDE